MTHETLITAQSEALATLVSLMRMSADDARPRHVINTIKQAAIAILRLKPLSQMGEDSSTRQRGAGEGKLTRPIEDSRGRQPTAGEGKPMQQAEAKPAPASHPRTADPDPTAHLSDNQFVELLQHLPDTLDPATDKHRLRLARYLARFHLGVTPEVKSAIRARAHRLNDALRQERAA